MTTHSWDEDPQGEWTLEIENVAANGRDYGNPARPPNCSVWSHHIASVHACNHCLLISSVVLHVLTLLSSVCPLSAVPFPLRSYSLYHVERQDEALTTALTLKHCSCWIFPARKYLATF